VRIVLCLLLTALVSHGTLAQQGPSPGVAQRLLRIIERNADDTPELLLDLDRLADSRGIRNTDRGYVRREQAALLIREERSHEALTLLQETLADQEDDYVPSLRLLLGQLLLMNNKPQDAITELRVWASQASQPRPSELSMLGYAYLQLEEFDEAISIFERILESAEIINDQWIEVLAYAYSRNQQGEQATALIEQVIAEQPGENRWWRQLSNIFTLLEDYDAGAASLAIADTVDELNYENGRRLAGLFSMLNMPAAAAEILQRSTQRHPEDLTFDDQMMLAELWMLARETDLAIAAFESARELAEDGEPSLRIAQLHLQWERFQQASAALRQSVAVYGEATPDEIWYLQGVVEINLDNLEAASAAIERLDPDGDYAERAANLRRFIDNQLAAAER